MREIGFLSSLARNVGEGSHAFLALGNEASIACAVTFDLGGEGQRYAGRFTFLQSK